MTSSSSSPEQQQEEDPALQAAVALVDFCKRVEERVLNLDRRLTELEEREHKQRDG